MSTRDGRGRFNNFSMCQFASEIVGMLVITGGIDLYEYYQISVEAFKRQCCSRTIKPKYIDSNWHSSLKALDSLIGDKQGRKRAMLEIIKSYISIRIAHMSDSTKKREVSYPSSVFDYIWGIF